MESRRYAVLMLRTVKHGEAWQEVVGLQGGAESDQWNGTKDHVPASRDNRVHILGDPPVETLVVQCPE